MASNKAGEARQSLQLVVLVPPTISISDNERIFSVVEGFLLNNFCLMNILFNKVPRHRSGDFGHHFLYV